MKMLTGRTKIEQLEEQFKRYKTIVDYYKEDTSRIGPNRAQLSKVQTALFILDLEVYGCLPLSLHQIETRESPPDILLPHKILSCRQDLTKLLEN